MLPGPSAGPTGLWPLPGPAAGKPQVTAPQGSEPGATSTEGHEMGWLRPGTAQRSPRRACLPACPGRPTATAASQPFSVSLFLLMHFCFNLFSRHPL